MFYVVINTSALGFCSGYDNKPPSVYVFITKTEIDDLEGL